jgi:hypothetical protein
MLPVGCGTVGCCEPSSIRASSAAGCPIDVEDALNNPTSWFEDVEGLVCAIFWHNAENGFPKLFVVFGIVVIVMVGPIEGVDASSVLDADF